MTYDPCNPDIAGSIERQGYYVCNFATNGYLPPFSYTVGFTESWRHPEVIVMGLPVQTNASVLTFAAELVAQGEKLTPGWEYSDFIRDYPVQFVRVRKQHIPDYFGYGLHYYGGAVFSALQLVWPAKDSTWPWESAFDPKLLQFQKLLDRDGSFSFFEHKNCRAFVSRNAFEGKTITEIQHCKDGDWVFLTDSGRSVDDVRIYCLQHVVDSDPSVNRVFDLGFGQIARRKNRKSHWVRTSLAEQCHRTV